MILLRSLFLFFILPMTSYSCSPPMDLASTNQKKNRYSMTSTSSTFHLSLLFHLQQNYASIQHVFWPPSRAYLFQTARNCANTYYGVSFDLEMFHVGQRSPFDHLYLGSSNLCRRIAVIIPVPFFLILFFHFFLYTTYITPIQAPSMPSSTTRHG